MSKKSLLFIAGTTFLIAGLFIYLNEAGHLTNMRPGGIKGLDVKEASPNHLCTIEMDVDDYEIIEFSELEVTCFRFDKYSTDTGGLSCVEGKVLSTKVADKINLPESYCE